MMQTFVPRPVRSILASSCCLLFASPAVLLAQSDPDIEEVVVTGSYIRNSEFAQNSPVDTVTQADLVESGTPSISHYIRDLTYTQNTNVVANVLASQNGAQTATGASFNLRGLGENSTLTLVDGVRTLSAAISTTLPEIAIDRMEMVLDGGSALYGSDAVAGVVNIIPYREFEGLRARTFYQRTEDGAMEDMSASLLWGRNFDNYINYVGAFEARKKTPLMQYERPREWKQDYGSSISGSPGTWRRNVGADPGVNLYQPHGGSLQTPSLLDPACGTFNEGFPAHGEGKFSTPSGVPIGSNCIFEYTQQFVYSADSTDYNLYNSVTWEANDWLRLNATLNNAYRVSLGRTTATTAVNGNNREVLLVRGDHPANPWGYDVSPFNWRPIATAFTHMPSHLDQGDGARTFRNNLQLNRLKLGADYDIAGSWVGFTYYSRQESKYMTQSSSVHLGKLQLALAGMGGPSGDQYFNPFGSADPRFPGHDPAIHANSLELTDWIFENQDNFVQDRDYLDIFETVATGEVLELPRGTMQMAIGFQWRDLEERNYANPLDALGHDYNTLVGAQLPTNERYGSEVRAYFAEIEVPILETLAVQIAARHEEFTTFGLESTTPKAAIRWEALPTLAFRASWSESFLAPTPTQARPFVPDENCGELFSGNDPFTATPLIGAYVCSSGNPNIQPETSQIRNFGFTWEPEGTLDGLSFSLDYQELEYTDRIRTLTSQDTVAFQFNQFLAETGIAESAYDPSPGSPTRSQANAWLAAYAAQPGAAVTRYDSGLVQGVFTQAANISSVWIDMFDLNVRYTFNTENWGTFSTALQSSYYQTYEYQDLFGGVVDASGRQNANTGIVPPLPDIKANLRLNWFRNNQSASVSANYWHDVDFDSNTYDVYGDGWVRPDTIKGETRVNARYAIVLDQYLDSEFTLAFGVNNVFDVKPQRLPIQGGFETRLSTPWHRQFWVSLDWTPGN